MRSSASRCVDCHASFADNHQLASIPDAARVAFDPVQHRAWRICAACDAWNLLGADASAAAMPELLARTAVPSAGAVTLHRIDKRLDLIRISGASGEEPSGHQLVALRALLDRRAFRRRLSLTVAGLGMAGLIGLMALLARFVPLFPFVVLIDASSLLLGVQFAFWIAQRKRNVPAILLNIAVVVASAWTLSHGTSVAGSSHFTLPIIQFVWLAGYGLVLPHWPILRGWVGHKAIRISLRQLESVTISWDDNSDAIAFHDLPHGLHCEGAAARKLGQKIFALAAQSGPSRPIFVSPVRSAEAAYQLLNGLGGLRGILNALDGFRRDSDGRVLLADIPTVYLRALDLAFAETQGQGREFGLGGLDDAQETAALAEGLDRENSG